MNNENDINPEDFNLPQLSNDPTPEEVQEHMAIIEAQAKKELGIDLSMAALFAELAQLGDEPSLMEITDLIAQKIANAKALLDNEPFPIPGKDIPVEGQYIFRVSVTHQPDIWRTIAFNSGHSLSHVHLAIQSAFEFDSEHLYGFYLDNRMRESKKFFNDPRSGEPPFANEHTLAELGLIPLQRFLYVFDFDDKWEFHVDLLEIATDKPTSPYPMVLEERGEAPMQYGNGGDLEEEDEEEDDVW